MFGDPPIRIQRARQLITDTHRSNRVCSSSALGLGGATLNLLLTASSPEAAAHIHRRRRDANLFRGVVTSLLMPRVRHWNRIAAEGMAPPTLTAVCPGHRVTSTKAPPPSPTPPYAPHPVCKPEWQRHQTLRCHLHMLPAAAATASITPTFLAAENCGKECVLSTQWADQSEPVSGRCELLGDKTGAVHNDWETVSFCHALWWSGGHVTRYSSR